MSKQVNVTIDRKLDYEGKKIIISLENKEFGYSAVWVYNEDLFKCYQELDIANDYGALDRMKEVIEWFSKQPAEIRYEEVK